MSTTLTRWAIAVVIGLVLLVSAVAISTRSDDARTTAPTFETGERGGGRILFT
jgi:hypothetical protein